MSKIDELLRNERVEWRKLGEVAVISKGRQFNKRDMLENGTYPVINGGILPSGYIDVFNSEENTITVSQGGASAGFVNFIEEKFWLGAHAFSVVPNRNIMEKYDYGYDYFNRFLFHILKMNQAKLQDSKVGAGIPSVSKDELSNIEIPLTSKETQEKIVKTLDKFTNYVTELQAELQARTKQYEYYRDMLLSEDYLNKISEELFIKYNSSLKKFKLKDIAEITRGKRLVRSELEETGKFPVFQNSLAPLGYYHDKNFTGDKACVISGGAAGDIFYIEEDFWAADDIFVITSDNILNKYIYYFLLSKKSLIKSKVRRASVPRLSREEIERVEIVVPLIGLQEKIVKILDKFQSLLSDTKGLLPQEIEQRQKQYEYYREKLLTFDIVDGTISRQTDRQTDRQLISSDYFVILKEAADIVGVKIFSNVHKTSLKRIAKYSTQRVSAEVLNEKNYVGVENLLKNKLGKVDSSYVPKSGKLIAFKKGNILIGNIRPYLRKIWIADVDGGTNGDVLTICIKEDFENKIIPKFLYQILSNESFFEYNIKFSKGAKMPRGDKKKIMEYEFVLPSVPVQEYVVPILDKFNALVNDIFQGLPKEIELRKKQYEYYREKLLGFKRSN